MEPGGARVRVCLNARRQRGDSHGLSHLHMQDRAQLRRLRVAERALPHPAATQAGAGRIPSGRHGRQLRSAHRQDLRRCRRALGLSPQGRHALCPRRTRPHPLRFLRRRLTPHHLLREVPGRGLTCPQDLERRRPRGRAPAHPRLRGGPWHWRPAACSGALRLRNRRRAAHAGDQRARAARPRPRGCGASRGVPRGHEHRPERQHAQDKRHPRQAEPHPVGHRRHARQAAWLHL